MPAFVSALNKVDLPTLGRPTMPHLRLMKIFLKQGVSGFIAFNQNDVKCVLHKTHCDVGSDQIWGCLTGFCIRFVAKNYGDCNLIRRTYQTTRGK